MTRGYSKRFFKFLWFIGALFLDFYFPNKYILSGIIIFFSVTLIKRVRKNSYLLILFGIIAYINFSTIVSEVLAWTTSLGEETLGWQNDIRESPYWLCGVQSLIILLATLNLYVDEKMAAIPVKDYSLKIENNPILFYFGYLLLWIIMLFFGYSSAAGSEYVSDTSSLYEYSLVICPIVWLYSNNDPVKKKILLVYCLAYCIKSMLHGDRSSMVPMGVFIYFLYFANYKLRIKYVVIFAVVGVLISNIISVYRIFSFISISDLSGEYIQKYGANMFTSDTVSQSYYTSVVTQLTHDKVENTFIYFFDFLLSIVFGGSYGEADVNKVVLKFYTEKFGGFYYSWPYFWFGSIGVFLASCILGKVLRTAFTRVSSYTNVLKMIMVIFSFRWYLYTCFDFFRGVLFVTSVFYFTFYFANNGLRTKSINKNERNTKTIF